MWDVTVEAADVAQLEAEADRVIALYEDEEPERVEEINNAVDIVRKLLGSGRVGMGKHSITIRGSDSVEEDDPIIGLFLTISINQHLEPPEVTG